MAPSDIGTVRIPAVVDVRLRREAGLRRHAGAELRSADGALCPRPPSLVAANFTNFTNDEKNTGKHATSCIGFP